MKFLFSTFIILLLSLSSLNVISQSNLFIDTNYTPNEMVEDFFNHPNITLSNITYIGDSNAIAFFDAGTSNLEIGAGILFSTGKTESVSDSATTHVQSLAYGNTFEDPDLDSLTGGFVYGVASIEFDFQLAESDSVQFSYIFASEEYPAFSCTGFNDGFGFFISGPGIDGPYSNGAENICLIPGTNEAVTINNINGDTCSLDGFEDHFIDNSGNPDIAFNGRTIQLPAYFYAEANTIYHAKLAIGNTFDMAFQSGVFLSFASLSSDTSLFPFTGYISGVEENVLTLENTTKYGVEYLWDFGNGETSNERYPSSVSYDYPGIYTISLTSYNYCCSTTVSQDVEITSAPLGISSLEEQILNVYPNPANNKLYIDNVDHANLQSILLINSIGVSSIPDYKRTSDGIEITLNNDLKSGIYILQLENAHGNMESIRFIKN